MNQSYSLLTTHGMKQFHRLATSQSMNHSYSLLTAHDMSRAAGNQSSRRGAIRLLVCLVFIAFAAPSFASPIVVSPIVVSPFILASRPQHDTLNILFYNVENLFDTEDDPATNDDEFTPASEKRWSNARFKEKRNMLYRAIAMEENRISLPDIIGLAEVENRFVVEALFRQTPLQATPYELVHRDSNDPRGIDVALLFRADRMTLLHEEYLPLTNRRGQIEKGRETLYAKGLVDNLDTLHLFVCHWPSRLGGAKASELRVCSAQRLRQKVDSIALASPLPKIIIMGDFNDTPVNTSLTKDLGALPAGFRRQNRRTKQSKTEQPITELYNLSSRRKSDVPGSYKYKENWELIDQMIVSEPLLKSKSGFTTTKESFLIRSESFLLIPDKTHGGVKPDRTYQGPIWKGGCSDHLPVRLLLLKRGR